MSRLMLLKCCAATLLVAGCASSPQQGYSFTDAYRADVRTVAVPIFENSTFSHGLEFTLTDAIIKEIHRTTPWRVTSGDGADTTLSGAITDSEMRRLSRGSETGLVQELAVQLTVDFDWKKNRSGEVLVSRRNFKAADPFVPARGARERLNLGERAAIDELAKDIVAELRSSW
ncbi:MAG: LPS assembly lipoprotein LptE [Planctomycetota bacterium]|nr:LPS assembly lipoprotein LptE [Planctomycetota bacterium]